MTSLYCTADTIGTPTGGGTVTFHELEALRQHDPSVCTISGSNINPALKGLPDTPFLADYLAMSHLPESIQLAHFYSGTFSGTVKLLKARNVPVTYTCPAHDRGVTVAEFKALYGQYPYPHIENDVLWSYFSQGLRDADVVIAPSRLSAEFLDKEGCKKVVVIPHGCNPVEKPLDFPYGFTAGYLGQIGPDKGLRYLMQAWGRLNLKNARMILAGDNTDTLGSTIQRESPAGQYQLLGRVNDVSDLYRQCSVFVLPSVCEAFGIGALEAMAHGRPVIVSKGAGVSELVEEGVTGFTFAARDVDSLAERLRWCYNNQAMLPTMGIQAQKASRDYTWDIIAKKYQTVWAGVL